MDYNPLKMPCDWDLAKKNALARRTAPNTKGWINYDDDEEPKKPETCPCYGFEIERKEIPYYDDIKSLKFLGSGFPLFYNFLKFCIILLCLQSLVAIYNIFNNSNGECCQKIYWLFRQKTLNLITYQMELKPINQSDCIHLKLQFKCFSIHSKGQSNYAYYYDHFTLNFQKTLKKLDNQIDESQLTPSDYTIMVTNIPKNLNVNYRWELTNLFLNYTISDNNFQITILAEEQKIQKTLQQKKIALQSSNMNYDCQDVKQNDIEIENSQMRIRDLQEEQFSGIAFISFESEKMKDLVLSQNKHTLFDKMITFFNSGRTPNLDEMELQYQAQKLFIQYNLTTLTQDKIVARIKVFFITLLIQGITFFIIYYFSIQCIKLLNDEELEKKRIRMDDKEKLKNIQIISFTIASTIVLINKLLLESLMKLITKIETLSTNTKFQISYAQKSNHFNVFYCFNYYLCYQYSDIQQ